MTDIDRIFTYLPFIAFLVAGLMMASGLIYKKKKKPRR